MKTSLWKKLAIALTLYLPSTAKVLAYKLVGAEIGRNVRIGLGSFIFAERIILKDAVVIANGVQIVCKEITMDEGAIIDNEARIGGFSTCTIGKGCFIGQRAFINVTEPVILEDDVGMGGHIYTHGVWPSYLEGYPRKFAGVTIKKGAWIPPDTTILPGVIIGEEAMIGAGAVITKSIPSRAFATGVPAEVTRSVDEIQQRLTIDQKDARFREIIDGFQEWIRDTMTLEKNIRIGDMEFILVAHAKSLFRAYKWGVFYAREKVTSELAERLLSMRKHFSKIVVISLKGISEDALKKLNENAQFYAFVDWINLSDYSCKRSSDSFFNLLYRYFRSYYGVRLKFGKTE